MHGIARSVNQERYEKALFWISDGFTTGPLPYATRIKEGQGEKMDYNEIKREMSECSFRLYPTESTCRLGYLIRE